MTVAFSFPFLVLRKSSGAVNHSFISIAFELTISRRFGKENHEDFPLIESLRKNHIKYFPYNEKFVIPSSSSSQK